MKGLEGRLLIVYLKKVVGCGLEITRKREREGWRERAIKISE